MKEYQLNNGEKLIDVNGQLLILIPKGLKPNKNLNFAQSATDIYKCKSFFFETTKNNRTMIKLTKGKGYLLTIGVFSGDRNWNNHASFCCDLAYTDSAKKDEAFTMAVKNSNGGGCWIEVCVAKFSMWNKKSSSNRPDLNRMGLSPDIANALTSSDLRNNSSLSPELTTKREIV